MTFYLTNPKTKKPSVTLTILVVGFVVATFKLLVSGATIQGITFGTFGGTDFAAVMGAVGMLYWGRASTERQFGPESPNSPDQSDHPPVEGPGQ